MIDFRYHLVSIVAVLLALAAGVVLGSGFVGGPLLDDIERRADDIRATNTELRAESGERQRVIESQDRFATEAQPFMIDGTLQGARVVVIDVQGTSRTAKEGIDASLLAAGATLAGTLELRDRLALDDDVKRDELALALGSTLSEPEDILAEGAGILGARLAAVATGGSPGARARLQELLDQLDSAEFVTVRGADIGPTVPPGASFVVVSGSSDPEPFPAAPFLATLSATIAEGGSAVMLAETGDSGWGVIEEVLSDSDAAAIVATASGIELAAGRVAAILTLDRAMDGRVGHHGMGPEAASILPEPAGTSGG